ncbi:MAG: hypothetical protein HOM96_00830 [Rickettsiales bacterium]|jgi:monovalent cation:H+ antiporter-2, CPA2 family|nr:hypothetical protein [Rickettsiales bacterium]
MDLVTHSSGYSLLQIIIVLFSAISVVLIFKKVKLSPVIGYIIAGAIIGPHGLAIVGHTDATKSLAEFGVVFLLFAIGLEMTFERITEMRKYILVFGTLQFLLTTVAFASIIYLFTKQLALSAIVGTAFSISSTAIVLKILSEEKNTNSSTGKICLSVLLFQDMAVIPIFIIIPLIGIADIDYTFLTFSILAKSLIALISIILVGRYILRPLMRYIISSRNDDIFIASTLLIIIGSAWVTFELGLSLGLGAFIAGVMIAETEFQHQVELITNQFKALFLGFFFMTEIGMNFDFNVIMNNTPLILIITLALMFIKTSIFFVILRLCNVKAPMALHTALLVSQSGEFAFIIFELASDVNIINPMQLQILSVVVGLSMALTPLFAALGKKFEKKFSYQITTKHNVKIIPEFSDHIIIAGYGSIGSTIGDIFQRLELNYVAIDTNLKHVSKEFNKKKPVFYGDISNLKVLNSLNINDARAIMLTMSDMVALNKTIRYLKKKHPNIPVIIRSVDVKNSANLKKINDKIILPEVFEHGLQMTRELLIISGASPDDISEILNKHRDKIA